MESHLLYCLQLGCGSGLPGLELNRHPQFHVDFQDFVSERVRERASPHRFRFVESRGGGADGQAGEERARSVP